MNKTLIAILLAAPLAGLALPAAAEESGMAACNSEPAAKWIGEDAAKARAVNLGYEVRDIKTEGSCYELYALDKDGKRVEARINPVSGELLNDAGDDDGDGL